MHLYVGEFVPDSYVDSGIHIHRCLHCVPEVGLGLVRTNVFIQYWVATVSRID